MTESKIRNEGNANQLLKGSNWSDSSDWKFSPSIWIGEAFREEIAI